MFSSVFAEKVPVTCLTVTILPLEYSTTPVAFVLGCFTVSPIVKLTFEVSVT